MSFRSAFALLCVLLLTGAGSIPAQVVVSSDGDSLFVTRPGEGSDQIDVGGEVVAVAANAVHAYALAMNGAAVVQVGLADGQIRRRIPVPCCGTAVAVTEDDGLLAVGASVSGSGQVHLFEPGRGRGPRTVAWPRMARATTEPPPGYSTRRSWSTRPWGLGSILG